MAAPEPAGVSPEPPAACDLCPRLVAFRETNRRRHPDFFNGAVGSFGDPDARLLVVGLAPGLKGANRTARPFTGDFAGKLLYPALIDAGLAHGRFLADPADGLTLHAAMVTNAVRCVPPENKPVGEEIRRCRQFLAARIASLPHLRAIFLLGRIAHDSVLSALGEVRARHPFAHGAVHEIGNLALIDSYHCSRYNVNTGRLNESMFRAALQKAVERL